MKIIELESANGKMLVQVNDNFTKKTDGRKDVSLMSNIINNTGKNIENLISNCIKSAIESTHNVLTENIENKPDELEMKFNIEFTLEGNVYFAKGSGGTNFEVTLKWKKN